MKSIIFAAIIFVCFITLNAATFIVDEAHQALVLQFGKIIGKPVTESGLHWKIPFLQDIQYFDKRILHWDGDEEQIPTKDKKYIWVDTTARWRIDNAVKFAESLHDEYQAKAKIDTILDGITRDTISNHNLVEAVRNTNGIIDRAKVKVDEAAKDPLSTAPDEVSMDIEPVQSGREKLSQQIVKRSTKELERFGIQLIDVQLRRIAYEKSVEAKVYDRMISERNRIAERIRSIGKGEEAKIGGKLNLDLKKIQSEAYRTSVEIKGIAEAKATEIYAKALSKDPRYYNFQRTLEAYKKTIPNKGQFIISTDFEFLKMLSTKP